MKTLTKFIYCAVAVVTLAIGAVTTNGAAGDLFASINGNGSNGGGFIYQYTPNGVQSGFASGLSLPRGVAFNHLGNLFVATNSCGTTCSATIVKITPDGVQSVFANISGPSGAFFAADVKFDNAGNLFVVVQDDTAQNVASTIYKFTPDGVQSTFGSMPGQGWGLAFDSAGNLLAADAPDVTIYKFTPDGTRSIFVGPSAFPPNQEPVGLAFDRFGNLFVSTESAQLNDVILKFTPDGVESTFATNLNYPRGLAFDRGGNLFVAEVNPGAPGDILKFTPNGVGTVFASLGSVGPEFLAFQLLPPPRPRPTPHPRPMLQP